MVLTTARDCKVLALFHSLSHSFIQSLINLFIHLIPTRDCFIRKPYAFIRFDRNFSPHKSKEFSEPNLNEQKQRRLSFIAPAQCTPHRGQANLCVSFKSVGWSVR